MREADRAELWKLVCELMDGGLTLPGHKTGLAELLRKQGREAQAACIEAGTGFSLACVAGDLEIISGGRRERLFPGDRAGLAAGPRR